jgi:MYXO-CTERM domain-containing protein
MCAPATGCVNTMIAGCPMTGGVDAGPDAATDAGVDAATDAPSTPDTPTLGLDTRPATDLAADRPVDALRAAVDARPADAAPGLGPDARTDGPRADTSAGGNAGTGGGGAGGTGGGTDAGPDGAVARDGGARDAGRDGGGTVTQTGSSGCSCEVGRAPATGEGAAPAALALLALAGIFSRRRRR